MSGGDHEIAELDLRPRGNRGGPVGVLARAFRDSPLNVAAIRGGPERRLRSNVYGMRAMLASASESALVLGAREAGTLSGALVAAAPHEFPLPPPPAWEQLRCLLGQGWWTLSRWGEVYRALYEIHPMEPHWYLSVLGVEPERQGQGVGSALLARLLERVDADRQPAYLESDRPENVPFYERAGFGVVREARALDVRVWCMWRDPK